MKWRRKREDDLERELRDHIELEAAESGDRAAAQRALGNTTWIKEETRGMWGWNWLSNFWHDVRHGIRLVRRTPVFSIFAAASLALGIGATAAIFSLYDAIVLRTLPVPRRRFANRDPIGVQITLAGNDVRTIVGVAKDM